MSCGHKSEIERAEEAGREGREEERKMMKSLPGLDYYEPRTMRITLQREREERGCKWEDKSKPSQSLKPATTPHSLTLPLPTPVRVDLSSLLATFFRPDAF